MAVLHKDLSSIAIFVAVAEEGGFSKAAEKLNLTNSVISHHVSKLEGRLGVTLLYRSTRQVALSEPGKAFYKVASDALKQIESATAALTADGGEPSGSLRIAMPSFVPDIRLQQAIWEFAKQYPKVETSISFSDDKKGLISDGFDIAFRLGALESSGMVAKKIADIRMLLVASPDFKTQHDEPIETPEDVAECACIALAQLQWKLVLSNNETQRTIEIQNRRIEVDNIYAAKEAVLAGLGVIPLPEGLCQKELDQGRLVHLLPDWDLGKIPLHAVWSNEARRNSLTRRLLSHLGTMSHGDI
jgi:DNA-binding transcriptional LysR family regulator